MANSSAVLCSLHRDRRNYAFDFYNNKFQGIKQIFSNDTDQNGTIVPKYITEKMNKINNSLEYVLNLKPGTPITLTKNQNLFEGKMIKLTEYFKF